jgi:hypothetical protein
LSALVARSKDGAMKDIADCTPTALAALCMCESLLLTLVNKGILPLDDAVESLENVVEVKQAAAEERHSEVYRKAAMIVSHIASSVAAAQTPDPARVTKETGG